MMRRRPSRRVMVWLLGGAGLSCAIFFATLPDTRGLAFGWPDRTAYMRQWLAAPESDGRLSYRPVPLAMIPASVRRAVLVSEDAGFYGHAGFDWHEIRISLAEAWSERRAPRGASTITQQLARNLYLSPTRSPFRKLREALIARRLEATLSKNRILELYLNVIEFGPGVYGVEAAARRYFDKTIAVVTPREAAELAATIPSPKRNNPATRTRAFERRAGLAYARAFGDRRGEVEVTPPGEAEVTPAPPDSSLVTGGAGEGAAAAGAGPDTASGAGGPIPLDSAGLEAVPVRMDTLETHGIAPSGGATPRARG